MIRKTPQETRQDVLKLRLHDNPQAWPEMEIVRLRPFTRENLYPNQRREVKNRTRRALGQFYPNTKGTLKQEVAAELEERAKQDKPVHFLDAGPGDGWEIHYAQQISPNIIGHGLGLNYPGELSPKPRGRWIRRHIESTVLKQKGKDEGFFDVIQDHYASTHAFEKAEALQNLLNSLRPGGVLISYGLPTRFLRQPLVDALARQEITVQTRDSADRMHIFRRKINAPADLAGPAKS